MVKELLLSMSLITSVVGGKIDGHLTKERGLLVSYDF